MRCRSSLKVGFLAGSVGWLWELAHGFGTHSLFQGTFLSTLEARSGSVCALGAVFAAFGAGVGADVLGADFGS